MPRSAKKPCRQTMCPALVDKPGYCEKHKKNSKAAKKAFDETRGTAAQRGYGYRWQKARKAFLSCNQLCKVCESNNNVTVATVVDHIIPHKGDMNLFWKQSNWQPLCKPCHDRKTATEDSNFATGRGG